jgi:hypothetical protein
MSAFVPLVGAQRTSHKPRAPVDPAWPSTRAQSLNSKPIRLATPVAYEPTTLGNMRQHGMTRLDVSCHGPDCWHRATVDVSNYFDDAIVELGLVADLMRDLTPVPVLTVRKPEHRRPAGLDPVRRALSERTVGRITTGWRVDPAKTS